MALINTAGLTALLLANFPSSALSAMTFEEYSPEQLVDKFLNPQGDVLVTNVKASPHYSSCTRYYTGGHSMGYAFLNDDNATLTDVHLVPDEGIMLSSGNPLHFDSNDSDQQTTRWYDANSNLYDADLAATLGNNAVFDACFIEFDFQCPGEGYVPQVSFKYMFGSEEYYEYVDSQFNDAFALLLNGVNIARLPSTESDSDVVAINNVNYHLNRQYFHGNDPGTGDLADPIHEDLGMIYPQIEPDGFTMILTAHGLPNDSVNTIKIVVADVGDGILDSWVLLQSGTFSCVDITEAPSVSPAPSSSSVPTMNKSPSSAPSIASVSIQPTSSPTKPLIPTLKPTAYTATEAGIEWPAGGPCMNEVFQSFGNNNDLQCTAKEVTTVATEVEGPTECLQGSTISVNLTVSIDFHATRYDLHIYTYTGVENSDPVFGESCALDHLTEDDQLLNQGTDNGVFQMDGDSCYDVVAQSGWTLENYSFQDNLEIPCEFGDDSSIQTVHVQSCYGWRTAGQNGGNNNNLNCDLTAAYPGGPSKCTCGYIDIGIPIILLPSSEPSASPTVSALPTGTPPTGKPTPLPTQNPTAIPTKLPTSSPTALPTKQPTSSPSVEPSTMPTTHPSSSPSTPQPTSEPSVSPTLSKNPSSMPSNQPSVSSAPSSSPTNFPSESSQPTGEPSSSPSVSSAPQGSPSASPSVSTAPSSSPTDMPSESSAPTGEPSTSPSTSSQPTGEPSSSPSVSSAPQGSPSASPSVSSAPSSSPTDMPSESSQPTGEPSTSPSTSSQPTGEPSSSPSVSSAPQGSPSASPSVSSAPSSSPTDMPSESSAPTGEPSASPSTSSQPTGEPSSSPSVSSAPQGSPSASPSVSSAPSSSPTDMPSESSQPTSEPSASPSTSSQPTGEPSSSPSVSSAPQGSPSASPSVSSAPSSMPSDQPSLSTQPSSNPSSQPSAEPSAVPSSQPSSVPSSSPSVSSAPSDQPSLHPSVSGAPEGSPSASPTVSAAPSIMPSDNPTESGAPSAQPSDKPSISSAPTSQPSLKPSTSGSPTSQPSSNPTESGAPSAQPSDKPSVSSAPTSQPSLNPSTSGSPTSQPSLNPTESGAPSAQPSDKPSVSAEPTSQPSSNPSLSSQPSSEPSLNPTESGAPSAQPSDKPSVSAEPTSQPSSNPSLSSQPSSEPSLLPSVSTEPSSGPSLAPSTSSAPSEQPSQEPSISTQPSSEPSLAPSTSSAPSEQPSQEPSISTQPSSEPSLNPSLSSAPTSQPSQSPSLSTAPSSTPSDSPSISSAPSSEPSENPTMSAAPSSLPTSAPSVSSAPSDVPSEQPTLSSSPSSEPSFNPSTSGSPTSQPSSNPTESAAPSAQPSDKPSLSSSPSSEPSLNPTESGAPSAQPSDKPSVSAEPTSQPSLKPSTSGSPTSEPSSNPTESGAPSAQPSDKPSVSSAPTSQPSINPSTSGSPTSQPSSNPTESGAPSDQPSASPSKSSAPSAEPSENPTTSTAPTSQPSQSPSLSTAPQGSPSASPTVSSAPSSAPTDSPSLSASPTSAPSSDPTGSPSSSPSSLPSSSPSSSPSISSAPSDQPTQQPSTSGAPQGSPSASPSVSSAPSSLPSNEPSLSQQPSSAPSVTPTVSSSPTSSPSDNPSVSSAPSSIPSGSPSISSEPTGGPTISPTISKSPSASPSDSPSVSSAPSSSPSDSPSVSSAPTSSPSGSPSISSEPTGGPTISPTISRSPSASPSDSPSVSSAPTASPSDTPTTSRSPSASPSHNPSVSSAPTTKPSQMPSVSSAPSSQPSSEPSSSTSPSSSPTQLSWIRNVLFNDYDADGIVDEGEPGLEDITIVLYNATDDTIVATTVTDENGMYEFVELASGCYYAQVFNRTYYFSPVVEGGNQVSANEGSPNGNTPTVCVSDGRVIDYWTVGLFEPVTVGNRVWLDYDADGVHDEDEPGLENITVILLDASGNPIDQQVSGPEGFYLFTGLPPGTYSVEFVVPDNYVFSPPSPLSDAMDRSDPNAGDFASDIDGQGMTPPVELESGSVDLSLDAGLYEPVNIGGTIFLDLDADGIRDPEDVDGVEGVTMVLYDSVAGTSIDEAVTSSDGSYLFSPVPPGLYHVRLLLPSEEYTVSPLAEGGNKFDSTRDPAMADPVRVVSGFNAENLFDGGLYQGGSVSIYVWNDANGNGIQEEGEGPYEREPTVNLYDPTSSDPTTPIATGTVSTDGTFTTSVPPGNYTVEFLLTDPEALFSPQDQGSDDSVDSDVDDTGVASITVGSGEDSQVSAGVTSLPIVGPNCVFLDSNGNGVLDAGEPPLSGIELELYHANGTLAAVTTSDEFCFYRMVVPNEGDYFLRVVIPQEFQLSPVVDGGNQISYNETDGSNSSPIVRLPLGYVEDSWNVALYMPVSIGNRVWVDMDGDGIQDEGEPGLEGIVVSLNDKDGFAVATTSTDETGHYLFDQMPPGNYSVAFDIPDGFIFTITANTDANIVDPVDGSYAYDDVTSDVNRETGATSIFMILSGTDNLSVDAGVFEPVTINGTTWHDLNADGFNSEDEPILEGSIITLFGTDGQIVDGTSPQVVGPSGVWAFEDLPPGCYTAEIEPPSGEWFLSPIPNEEDGEGQSTDFNPADLKTGTVCLQSGESGDGSFDAGFYRSASVGDRVWFDSEPNGMQDFGEGPMNETISVKLYDALGYLKGETETSEGGYYQFDDLIPGTYEVEFALPSEDYNFAIFKAGDNDELDSDASPKTGRAKVTLQSGEHNNNIDAGMMDASPYYPDWTNDVQVCTNDGFDPAWLEIQKVNYLYSSKEACCKQHFWWRMTQCMANEEFKFFKVEDKCDSKIVFEDWEENTPGLFQDNDSFDTLEECCANMFWYDLDGCMSRSPVMFKYEFCVDVEGLVEPLDCQNADIYANVLEDSLNTIANLGQAEVDANITKIGEVSLTKEFGSTVCGGSLEGQAFTNEQTGSNPDIEAAAGTSLSVCGSMTIEAWDDCKEEVCLNAQYEEVKQAMLTGDLTTTINQKAATRLPPVPELQDVAAANLTLSNLLLPPSVTGDFELKYFQGTDLTTCSAKPTLAFNVGDVQYDTLHACCSMHFSWDIAACCVNGGGCPELPVADVVDGYYPTWIQGELCAYKSGFESWEERFDTLEECCNAKFPYDLENCNPTPAP